MCASTLKSSAYARLSKSGPRTYKARENAYTYTRIYDRKLLNKRCKRSFTRNTKKVSLHDITLRETQAG